MGGTSALLFRELDCSRIGFNRVSTHADAAVNATNYALSNFDGGQVWKHNMKFHLFIFTLLLAVMAALAFRVPPQQPPPGGWKKFPTFPGQGPFNPKIGK
ncbi:hypothetical protein EAI_08798 [Harpegnathos saltator]|uniref:Uncharacterized protein n=1 Tax=Harpegnathos saltator TaxID=610380 RepID=E2B7M5_HARSA|nr:hypothetical protein EAI_08798 [Harpegnathos saltator]